MAGMQVRVCVEAGVRVPVGELICVEVGVRVPVGEFVGTGVGVFVPVGGVIGVGVGVGDRGTTTSIRRTQS
jgi:hypothetical protein